MKVVVLFFFCSLMYGQKLHHHMLSAQGGVATTSTGIKVSHTIAQQGVIGTSSTKKVILGQGFQQSKIVAKQGGNVAKVALKELEAKTGKKVVRH